MVDLLEPLYPQSNINIRHPFSMCLRKSAIDEVEANYREFFACARHPVTNARLGELYATWFEQKWYRGVVKKKFGEFHHGRTEKLVFDYLDRPGCPDLTRKVELYYLNDERLRKIPPGMVKLFLWGVNGCNFNDYEFVRLFNKIKNQKLTGILYERGNEDRAIPRYFGDIIFTEDGMANRPRASK